MDEDVALTTILDFLRTATALPVSLESEEREVRIPGVILDEVRSSLVSATFHGVKSFAGEVVDEFGQSIGSEHHFYHRVTADLVVRSEDLGEAYDEQKSFFLAFLPHVDDPRGLHEDITQLELSSATPRRVPFREPDWHEVGRILSFVYVQREILDGDTLEEIEQVVDPDFTVEFDL